MIHSRSLGAIRSRITCSVHLVLLVKVRPRADLVNSLRWIRRHICRPRARVGIRIGPTGIRLAGRLYDTSRNDGAECLQAILLGGHRHVVIVKYHCAAAAAIGGGPLTDVPSRRGNQGAELRRCGRAVRLRSLDRASVDPFLGVGAALNGFDLAVEQGRQGDRQGRAERGRYEGAEGEE